MGDCLNTVTDLDDESEFVLSSLYNDISTVIANYPEIKDTSILQCFVKLISKVATSENFKLMEEMSALQRSLQKEKELRSEEINNSFKFQDSFSDT